MTKIKSLKDVKALSPKAKILLGAGLFVLVAAAGLVVKSLTAKSAGTGPRMGTVAVEIAPVSEGTIRDLGLFSGTLVPKSQFVVAPKVSGKLKKLYVDIGDRLSDGQLIAQLEDEEYQQAVLQAEADLNVAKANLEEARSALELAKKELERSESLYTKGILSNAQIDAARAQANAQDSKYKVAVAQVSNREAALEAARVRLSYTRITATWDKGNSARFVGERFAYEGALLSSNSQIISVLELEPITAVIYATDKEYFRIKPGQEVAVSSTAFPGRVFQGAVTRVAPMLQEASRQARVEIDIRNDEAVLKPGMFINVEIEFARRERAKLVPFSALVQRGGRQGVFLADPNALTAAFTPVTVGIVEGELAEVLEPADFAGFAVVLGQHLLQDGMGILLPEKTPAPAKAKPAAAVPAGR
ncbi:MAG: efflux RND transporter periplasmic adaptor subunit [Candidatus Aminicenantes bacterium]|nr:efflux RND transporter periplasmic adaptor subunit [Candidatus Aminicenantes bacterium]